MAAARPRPRQRAAVAHLRLPRPGVIRLAARIAPSWRSLLVGALIVALAGGAYVAARETSMFAVRTIEVHGAPSEIAGQVRAALEPLTGTSLVKIGDSDVQRRLGSLISVAAASSDRDFPHTLRVYVRVEQPLAVLRQGAAAWLVSEDGRVLRELPHPRLSSLPRVWLPAGASVTSEAVLGDPVGLRGVAALRALGGQPLGASVRDVRTADNELTLILRSGLEVRLGDASNLRLKFTVARAILPQLAPPGYLDVSVPERAVAYANPKVEG
jgi:cell division septal protein FtsQ